MNKNNFRETCLKRLKNNSSKYIKDKLVIASLDKVLLEYKNLNILAFIPLSIEPNIYKWLLQNRAKHNLYTPFMEDVSFKMVKFRLPLRLKKFNLFEPPNSFSAKSKIDVAIVPVVGVDGDFRRVGFGKGMYDRFFDKLDYKVLTIFIQSHDL